MSHTKKFLVQVISMGNLFKSLAHVSRDNLLLEYFYTDTPEENE